MGKSKVVRVLNDRGMRELRRFWKDLDVVDAQENQRIFIIPEDAAGALPKNPGHCVVARACRRSFGTVLAQIWRTVAFIELPGPDGINRVERFLVSKDMRNLIENFDRKKTIIPKGGFLFKRPYPSNTLDGKRRRNKPSRVRFDANKKRGPGKYIGNPLLIEVRNGSGRIEFIKKKS